MKVLRMVVLGGLLALAGVSQAKAGCGCPVVYYGGCVDPFVGYGGYGGGYGGYCAPAVAMAPAAPAIARVDTGPVTEMRVVLVPEYVTETRSVCDTEYKEETRKRVTRVYTTVPIQEERYRFRTVYKPKTETKRIEHKISVPETIQKTHEFVTTVPVWSDVEQEYTVKVPVLKDVDETYHVQVPVLKDEEFTYTVNVPRPITQVVYRSITNVVPATRIRHVSHCVPVATTRLVTKDYGHWEARVEEIPVTTTCYQSVAVSGGYGGYGYSNCGGVAYSGGCGLYAGGCGTYYQSVPVTSCSTTTVTRNVWVPRIVQEEETVVEHQHKNQEIKYTVYEQYTEQVPYDCVYVVYSPESRTAMRKTVAYVNEPRKRTRKVAEYVDEPRKRTQKVLTFKEEKKTETYPFVVHKQQVVAKEISYTVQVPEQEVEKYTVTRQERVSEDKIEEYMARVAVPVVRQVQYQVVRMVPKVITVQVDPCATGSCGLGYAGASSGGAAYGGGYGVYSIPCGPCGY